MSIFSGMPMGTIDFGFPWPIFPTGFWGIGVVMQYIEYHYKHGGGADRVESSGFYQDEVVRHAGVGVLYGERDTFARRYAKLTGSELQAGLGFDL